MALVNFKERRYQVLFEDFRIFIQGAEVTQWVIGAVTYTRANRDGPGTASFTLDNALDRFVLTDENLTANKWRDTNDKYSEAAKHSIYLYKTGAKAVTVDRIAELTNTLFDRNIDIVKARTTEEVAAITNDRKRRRAQRNVDRSTVELEKTEQEELVVAASDTLQDMPADTILNHEHDVEDAVFEQMVARGLSPARAREAATEAVRRRRNQLTRAGGKRPAADGPALDSNPDKTAPERRGRFKNQQSIRNPVDPDTGDARWPLQNRSIIFHKNDPVRIWVHNPLTEQDHWLWGFTGFVDQYPLQQDYVTGDSTLTIQCYDIKALMQKMRVSQNIIRTAAPEPLFTERSSIFADLLLPSRWGQAFANLSFENAIALLTTGTDLTRKGDKRRFGIGDLAIGKVVTYPVTDNIEDQQNRDTLDEWHTLCLNGPSPVSDFNTIAATVPLTSRDVEAVGRETTSDGAYAPTRAYVHFLLPRDGTAARTLVQETFDTGTEQRDWTNRFEIVTDFCARLDYEFTVLPNGDLAFEFPMYDFLPEDFGDWAPAFRADQHLINGQVSDESGEIVSAMVVTGGAPRPQLDGRTNAPQSTIPRGIVQSSVIAARTGITVEQTSLPFTYDPARLRSLAFVEFQKRLASANTLDQDFGFRPYLMPNRPILNAVEQRMGLTSSVTDTLQLFSVCSTNATVRYVRQIRQDGTFRFITGSDSMPISYRNIFKGSIKSVGNSKAGVRAHPEFDGDPSALEDAKTTAASAVVLPENDDRPPDFVHERRPGTFFALAPSARRIAETLAATLEPGAFLLTNIPRTNGTSFAIRARDPESGRRLFSNAQRVDIARTAKDLGYILIDTGGRFVFEARRPNQPDFIVRPNG
jgi:hypothetical protein